jgi:DNA-binding MarR family transcriptional regulator
MVTGRQACRSCTVKASTTATSQPAAIATITGHGCSSATGNGGGVGASGWGSGVVSAIADKPSRSGTTRVRAEMVVCTGSGTGVGTLWHVTDADARLASDLSLAVLRLARQLRFRRPDSPVSLSQLSALATLGKEGPMTPGALAFRERVRPPSMTRVIASLGEIGFVDRGPHPDDGRQVLVSVSEKGAELLEVERRASREWLQQRLAALEPEQRKTLLVAAELMLAIVDEST